MKFTEHELAYQRNQTRYKKEYAKAREEAFANNVRENTFYTRWQKYCEGKLTYEDVVAKTNKIKNKFRPDPITEEQKEFKPVAREILMSKGYARNTFNERWKKYIKGQLTKEELLQPKVAAKQCPKSKPGTHRYNMREKAKELGIEIKTFNTRYLKYLKGQLAEEDLLTRGRIAHKKQHTDHISRHRKRIEDKYGFAVEELVLLYSIRGMTTHTIAMKLGVSYHAVQFIKERCHITQRILYEIRKLINGDAFYNARAEAENDEVGQVEETPVRNEVLDV